MENSSGFWKRAADFLLTFLKAVYLFMPGIFSLVAYYFIIIKMPIGQDMLMQSGEHAGPYSWTIVGIGIWMLFSWYSSRLVADTYVEKCDPPYYGLFVHFPRVIGYNVAVGLQLAILNLPTVAALDNGAIVLFFAHNTFYFLLNQAMLKKQKKFIIICSIVGAVYLTYLLVMYLKVTRNFPWDERQLKHLNGGFSMLLIFFVFQIIFVALVLWRRKQIDRQRFTQLQSNAWKKGYNILALFAFLLYVVILESTKFATGFGALAVTFVAFGLWVGFIYLVKNYSIKLNVRLGLPILILAIVYGLIWPHPYKVRLEPGTSDSLYKNRPGVDAFFIDWINNPARQAAIQHADSSHPFNVYTIIADGGASKSGYWVAAVLSKLQEESPSGINKFSNHLLSLAGASGGSVGNAAFYALLRESMKGNTVDFSSESRNFFQADFFSSSFARFLGPDIARHIFPLIFMDDRAAVLEQSMEESSDSKLIGRYFKGTVDTVFDSSVKGPMLFINTTNLQSGSPDVVSNINIKSFSERMDILEFLDTTTKLSHHNKIKLSTSVILGARFPYISPAGEIDGKYFVDGGYFDNSGGGITLEMLQYLESKINDSTASAFTQLKGKLKFKVIYISNGNTEKGKDHGLHPLVNDIAAPLLTVAGTYGKQTSLSNDKLQHFIMSKKLDTAMNPFQTLNLPMDTRHIDTISYPMNWVISDFNLDRMKKNLDSIHVNQILQ